MKIGAHVSWHHEKIGIIYGQNVIIATPKKHR